MKKVINLIITIFLTGTTYASTGGVPVNYGDYPYLAVFHGTILPMSLSYSNCIASLLSNNTAVISAHCSTEMPINIFQNYLYVNLNSQLTAMAIKQFNINPQYSNAKPFYDIGLIFLKNNLSGTKFLTYTPTFDPNVYINSQLGHAILFPFFGLDKEALQNSKYQINTGQLSAVSSNQCADQTQDLIENEGSKLAPNTLKALKALVPFLRTYNGIFLCVFNKKSDSIQETNGDSGSPLIIQYKGTPTIAGVLRGNWDISTTQNYSRLVLFINPHYSENFLTECLNSHKTANPGTNSKECVTLLQWWEQFRIGNSNTFALEGSPGFEGLVNILPILDEKESSLRMVPSYIESLRDGTF